MLFRELLNLLDKTDSMKEKSILAGHIACFAAYAIFGLNIIVCKDLTSGHLISPIAIFTLRSIGAGIIFWILSIFLPKEKVEKKDYLKIFAAAFLGYFMTQLSFLMAIPDVTPMHCSIISAMSPIYTMFIAAIVLKEPLSWHKTGGVVLSLCGIIFLIINNTSGTSGVAESRLSGILLMFVNSLSFSLYLGIFKPVIAKYSVITFMKWIFLFSALMSIPLSFREVLSFEWTRIPSVQMFELAYLIIFATFLAYFLIPFGQKHIRPTLVSMYSYVQPIIATLISIILGMDLLTWQKILAAVMVFSGVYVVNRSRRA